MHQVTDAIADGGLASGDHVPSQRGLSEQRGIAWLTEKKAYEGLEAWLPQVTAWTGHLRRRPAADQYRIEREARVQDAARTLPTQASFAGLRYQDFVQLLGETDRELTGSDGPSSSAD